MTLPVGKFIAIAESAEFGQLQNDNQTPYVEVTFRVLDGEHKDETMSQRFFLSDAAAKYTIANLRTCGCTMPGGDVTNFVGLGTKRVEIVVQKQKPKPGETESKYHEIRFINDPDAPRGGAPIADDKKAMLREKLRGAVLAEQTRAGAAPAAAGTKIPF